MKLKTATLIDRAPERVKRTISMRQPTDGAEGGTGGFGLTVTNTDDVPTHVVVQKVEADGVAARAGLCVGDRIETVHGNPVLTHHRAFQVVDGELLFGVSRLEIDNEPHRFTRSVTLAKGDVGMTMRNVDAANAAAAAAAASEAGVIGGEGVVVSEVEAGKGAARESVKVGDVILGVNGHVVHRHADAMEIIGEAGGEGASITLAIRRDDLAAGTLAPIKRTGSFARRRSFGGGGGGGEGEGGGGEGGGGGGGGGGGVLGVVRRTASFGRRKSSAAAPAAAAADNGSGGGAAAVAASNGERAVAAAEEDAARRAKEAEVAVARAAAASKAAAAAKGQAERDAAAPALDGPITPGCRVRCEGGYGWVGQVGWVTSVGETSLWVGVGGRIYQLMMEHATLIDRPQQSGKSGKGRSVTLRKSEVDPGLTLSNQSDAFKPGVVVSAIEAGLGADRAGLSVGDVILSINGQKVGNRGRAVELIDAAADEIELDMPVMPAKGRNVMLRKSEVEPGLTLCNQRDAFAPGVVVSAIEAGLGADQAGLSVGDVILSINGQPVGNHNRAVELIDAAADEIELAIPGANGVKQSPATKRLNSFGRRRSSAGAGAGGGAGANDGAVSAVDVAAAEALALQQEEEARLKKMAAEVSAARATAAAKAMAYAKATNEAKARAAAAAEADGSAEGGGAGASAEDADLPPATRTVTLHPMGGGIGLTFCNGHPGTGDGVLIAKAFEGQPAAAAGLEVGDRVASINGVVVNHHGEAVRAVLAANGGEVTLVIAPPVLPLAPPSPPKPAGSVRRTSSFGRRKPSASVPSAAAGGAATNGACGSGAGAANANGGEKPVRRTMSFGRAPRKQAPSATASSSSASASAAAPASAATEAQKAAGEKAAQAAQAAAVPAGISGQAAGSVQLPMGWREATDKTTGSVYYWNAFTRKTAATLAEVFTGESIRAEAAKGPAAPSATAAAGDALAGAPVKRRSLSFDRAFGRSKKAA